MNKQKSTIITLVISDALIQYPKLAEQAVTANLIKLQNYPAPVRPCVKNWIADFHYAMGSGKHSPIERGNYLFHSENGKVLTAPERQKLGMILKSLDEQTLLTIDPVREVIVFEDAADIAQTNNGSGMNHGSGRTYDSQNISTGAIVNSGPGNALDSRLRGNDKVGNTQSSLSAGQVSRFQTGNTRDPLPVGSADNSTNEFAQRQDNLEKFYQAPQSTQVAPQQMQTDKPPVVLKNISFSPGLVVVPKINDAQNENDTNKHTVIPGLTRNPERGKDLDSRFHGNDTVMNDEGNSAYYSIPGSKPPIGSSDFHQNSIAIHPVIERNIQPGNVPNSLPIQPAMSTGQMNGYEENNNGNVAQTGATQDRDSLSDEMLLKLYQERKQQKNVSSPNFAQSQNLTFTSPQKLAGENPYHITSTNGEEKGVNQKNVVNLKN